MRLSLSYFAAVVWRRRRWLIYSPYVSNSISTVAVEIGRHASCPNRQSSQMASEISLATVKVNNTKSPQNHRIKRFTSSTSTHVRVELCEFCLLLAFEAHSHPFVHVHHLATYSMNRKIVNAPEENTNWKCKRIVLPFWKHLVQNVWRHVNTNIFWFSENDAAQRKQRIQPNFSTNRSICWRSIFNLKFGDFFRSNQTFFNDFSIFVCLNVVNHVLSRLIVVENWSETQWC